MSSSSSRLTLPQKGRLKKKREFQEVYGDGRRVGGRMLTVWALPGPQGTRAAFVAGRRVGRAVARNRAKRLMKEAFRVHQPSLVGHFHIVMSARPGCPQATLREVQQELHRQLRQAGCLGAWRESPPDRSSGRGTSRRPQRRRRSAEPEDRGREPGESR